jgi:hypothetical protein
MKFRMTIIRTKSVMHKVLCLLLLLLLSSCSSEEKPSDPGSQKPQEAGGSSGVSETSQTQDSATGGAYSLQITPTNATRSSTIYLVAQGFKPSNAETYWLVNDRILSSPAVSQLNTAEIKKGDRVQAKATIQGKEILSNTIQIGNSPPVISKVKILPEIFKPGDALSVEVSASDADGDEVTVSYEWTKNGEPAGNSKRIEASLRRGDRISVKITPFDGETYGRSGLLDREIINLPPMIIEDTIFNFDGKMYSDQIKATDPDGDTLTYSLKSAPSGMTIGSASGLIKWNVPAEVIGKTSFTVSVSDGHGGEAAQTIVFDIRLEQKR